MPNSWSSVCVNLLFRVYLCCLWDVSNDIFFHCVFLCCHFLFSILYLHPSGLHLIFFLLIFLLVVSFRRRLRSSWRFSVCFAVTPTGSGRLMQAAAPPPGPRPFTWPASSIPRHHGNVRPIAVAVEVAVVMMLVVCVFVCLLCWIGGGCFLLFRSIFKKMMIIMMMTMMWMD